MLLRIHASVPAAGFAWIILCGAPLPGITADSLYRFTDQNGDVHYSNAPTDSRYEKIQGRSIPASPDPTPPVTAEPSPRQPTTKTSLGRRPQPPHDSIYRFTDGNGIIHFSNVPTNPRYRKTFEEHALGRINPMAPSTDLHQTIQQTSQRYRLNPELVQAVIRAESAYDPKAVSTKGAMGLMQLMPKTASSLNVSNPYDPEQNIAGGARHLRYLLDRFEGNLELALAAYNAGESRVLRENRIPPIGETRRYVRKVLRFYQDFTREGLGPRSARIDTDTPPLVTRRFINYLSPN